MSERIEVGDLVMVIAGVDFCGCPFSTSGMVGVVSDISESRSGKLQCPSGSHVLKTSELLYRIPEVAADPNDLMSGWYVRCHLKKIPPLKEPERIAEKEHA